MKKTQEFIDYVLEWRVRVFGEKNPIADSIKLMEESKELHHALSFNDTKNIEGEIADCFILLMNISSSNGYTLKDVVKFARAKMFINENRNWNFKGDGTAQHTEEELNELPF